MQGRTTQKKQAKRPPGVSLSLRTNRPALKPVEPAQSAARPLARFDWRPQVAYITLDKCWRNMDLGTPRPRESAVGASIHSDHVRATDVRHTESLSRRNMRRTTVETHPIDSPDSEPLSAADWQQSLTAQRTRAEELLAAQSETINGIEQELAAELTRLSTELAEASGEGELDRQQWRQRAATLEDRLTEAQRIKATLLAQQETWQQVQAELETEQQRRIERLDTERSRLDELSEGLDARQRELVSQQTKLDLALAEATTSQEHYQERAAELEAERHQLQDLKDDTRRQRRRIAKEFRQERTAIQQQLTEARQVAEMAAKRLAEATEQSAHDAAARAADDSAAQGAASQNTAATEMALEAAREATADWQRKYDLAMEELRSLRSENEELQSRPKTPTPMATPTGPAVAGGGFDWEAEKRRMIDELDEGHDSSEPGSRRDRLAIEDVIRRTDDIVAAKDREIAQLRRELDEQREANKSQINNVDELEQLVDADELIQQERSHLEELKRQLQEKLRKAEVNLSMERAKMARERAELEELAAAVQVEGETATPETNEEGKAPRGRWLSRLGLSGEEEE